MNRIHLQQTLPQVFAGRDTVTSQIWHQNIVFSKGKRYLVEAASGTGKSSLCSYIYGYRQDYQGIINFDEQNIRSLSVNEWADIRKHSLSILFQELHGTACFLVPLRRSVPWKSEVQVSLWLL